MNFAQALAQTSHNFETMLEGKSTFSQFADEEGAIVEGDITALPAVVQPFAQTAWNAVTAGASVLVGAGETALGPILNANSDDEASLLINMMALAGIPTQGPLSVAEHAALVTLINGMKAGLDRIGLHIVLTNGVSAPVAPAKAPAAAPAPLPQSGAAVVVK